MPMFQARIIRQEVAITDMEGDTLEDLAKFAERTSTHTQLVLERVIPQRKCRFKIAAGRGLPSQCSETSVPRARDQRRTGRGRRPGGRPLAARVRRGQIMSWAPATRAGMTSGCT
jgi:hypothetical protein